MTASIKALSDGLSGELQVGGNPSLRFGADTSGQLAGFRNRIINGNMVIAQRGTVATTNVTGAAYFCVDRWYGQTQASGAAVTFARISDGSLSLTNKYHLAHQTNTIKGSLAATDYCFVGEKVEGFNVADLLWGTASAKPITLRFRARVDNVGASAVISVSVRNGASNRSYVTPITITSSASGYSITIPGDTTGTWTTDNTSGFDVSFCSASGTTYQTATTGVWQAGNYIASNTQSNLLGTLNAALNITDVQLEAGSIATPFEQRPYGLELSLCQRYYWRVGGSVNAVLLQTYQLGGTAASLMLTFPTEMRVTPTATKVGTWLVTNCGQPNPQAYSNRCAFINATASSTSYVSFGTDTNTYADFSAEL